MKVDTAEVEEAVMTVIKIQAGVILETENLTDLQKVNADRGQLHDCEKQIKMLGEKRQVAYEQ